MPTSRQCQCGEEVANFPSHRLPSPAVFFVLIALRGMRVGFGRARRRRLFRRSIPAATSPSTTYVTRQLFVARAFLKGRSLRAFGAPLSAPISLATYFELRSGAKTLLSGQLSLLTMTVGIRMKTLRRLPDGSLRVRARTSACDPTTVPIPEET